jgi:hypothetical protein
MSRLVELIGSKESQILYSVDLSLQTQLLQT